MEADRLEKELRLLEQNEALENKLKWWMIVSLEVR